VILTNEEDSNSADKVDSAISVITIVIYFRAGSLKLLEKSRIIRCELESLSRSLFTL